MKGRISMDDTCLQTDHAEISNYFPGNCFACSRNNMKGLRLRFWYSEKGCFTRYTIPDYMCGFTGLAHGGIIALLLDETAAYAVISHLVRLGPAIRWHRRSGNAFQPPDRAGSRPPPHHQECVAVTADPVKHLITVGPRGICLVNSSVLPLVGWKPT